MRTKTIYFLIDRSASMRDCDTHSRASAVNQAMREVMNNVMPRVLDEKDAELKLQVAVLTFSSYGLIWHMERTDMENAVAEGWADIELSAFSGGTPTGEAIKAAIDDINTACYGEPDPDAVAPAFILISDGMPNGTNPTYEEVLDYADKGNPNFCPAFRYSNRTAIGMQVDEDGRKSLEAFGRVSSSVAAAGCKTYYDCTDDKVHDFVEIIKSCTLAHSLNM